MRRERRATKRTMSTSESDSRIASKLTMSIVNSNNSPTKWLMVFRLKESRSLSVNGSTNSVLNEASVSASMHLSI